MTVDSNISSNDYLGNGVTTVYPYGFKIFADTDLVVTKRDLAGVETTLALNTDYTVSGVLEDTGGSITLTVALPGDGTESNSYALNISRALDAIQPADFTSQGTVRANIVERALDRCVMLIQQLIGKFNRSIQIPITDTGISTVLPSAKDRALKTLAFDASGNVIAGVAPSGGIVSAAMIPVVQAATRAAARAAMGPWNDVYAGPQINVKNPLYGAVGDGVADDAPAFRLALSSVAESGGTVCVPSGVYYFSSVVYIPQRSFGTGVGINIIGENAVIKGTGLGGNTLFETGTGTTSSATNFGQANESAASIHYGLSIRGFTFKDCGTAIRLFNAIQRSDVSDNWFTNCTTAIYAKRCFYLDVVNNHAYLGTPGRLAATPIFHFDDTCNQMSIIGNSANGIYVSTRKGIGFLFSLGASGLTMIDNATEGCVTGVSVTGQLSAAEMRGWYIENDTTGIDLGSQAKAGLTIDASYFYGNTTAITGTNWTSGEWGSANVIDATGGTVSLNDASNTMEVTPAPQYLNDAQATPSAARFPTGLSLGAAARAHHRRVVYDSGIGYDAALVVDAVDAKRLPSFAYTGGHQFNGPSGWAPFVSQTKSLGSTVLDTDIDFNAYRMMLAFEFSCTYNEGGTVAVFGLVFANGNVFRCESTGGITIAASNNSGKLRLTFTHAGKTSPGWTGQIRHM